MGTNEIINGLLDRADRVEDQSAGRIMKRAAKHIEELERKHRWIPVTERLPDHGETVLVFGRNGGIYTAYCSRKNQDAYWHKLNAKNHYCNPTHWMPLPKPPREV